MPSGAGTVRSTLRWVSALALVAWSLLWGTLLALLASAGEIVAPWGVALPITLLALAAGAIFVPRIAGIGAFLLAVAGVLLFDLPPLRFATPFVISGVLLVLYGPWTWIPRGRRDERGRADRP